ncbi:hypothetical protein BDZ97DRAFT_1764411 [Flammula alnicola]|nr:hypothetical protein BDZ97DRAFT_1764411 [Flammula alnicola]
MTSTVSALSSLKAAFAEIDELPYCTGSVPLDSTTSTVFYRSGDNAEALDFSNVADAQLEALAKACQPASFGVDQKDVLDESYRQAGKMDAGQFATQFSPMSCDIIGIIIDSLLKEKISPNSMKIELYKLNVYGPGSFFKAHVDTPRSDTMFGSLVVVLPTRHEGGSLVFRHRGREWTFDSAKAVSTPTSPHAAFVAFFSDVEHEVTPVTSGYRVTLTYNLYYAKQVSRFPPSAVVGVDNTLARMKSTLQSVLAD